MRNTKSMWVILLITLFFIGSAAAGTEKEMTPSGTIHFEEWQVMAILGGDWGHGTLGYNGKTYKFKLTGMGAGGMGAQKISATGEVFNLKDISDFPGGYSELRGGIAAGKGVGGLYVRNDKGVVLKLKTHGEGVALSVGVQGITIQMEK